MTIEEYKNLIPGVREDALKIISTSLDIEEVAYQAERVWGMTQIANSNMPTVALALSELLTTLDDSEHVFYDQLFREIYKTIGEVLV